MEWEEYFGYGVRRRATERTIFIHFFKDLYVLFYFIVIFRRQGGSRRAEK